MVYKEGGAPAVFQSPKCPRWTLPNEAVRTRMRNCQSYIVRGRRKHQEDRTLCALDLQIPFPGRTGVKEVIVGMIAVFDGHNGAEASEMASKLLLEYFFLHVYFLLDGIYSVAFDKPTQKFLHTGEPDSISRVFNWADRHRGQNVDLGRLKWVLPEIFDGSFHMEILKESLLRAIHDIDATFSKEAFRNNLDSGSTANIVLIVDNQILVSNVGDSKAMLCSEKFQSPQEIKDTLLKLYRQRRSEGVTAPLKEYRNYKMAASSDGLKHFSVKELTRDHHPDRDDERLRVEASGGYVEEWGGVARVNGELAVSRAIGDVPFKSSGVISAPEVTDWQPLTANDTYLVAASDGVFEKMTTQDVCDLLWDVNTLTNEQSELPSSCLYSLAECIVKTAFEKGSMDNIAAVVLPLKSTEFCESMVDERWDDKGGIAPSASEQKLSYTKSANALVPLEYASNTIPNFNRLLVERTPRRNGLFYLYEDLNENMEYKFGDQKDEGHNGTYDLPQALPGVLSYKDGGPLNFYDYQNLCLNYGMDTEGDKGQCINPESFNRFLGLLESIPFPNNVSNSSGSSEYEIPNSRYILKKRYSRGSYGEVWMAFHWNHSQNGDLSWNHSAKNCTFNNAHLDPHLQNTSTRSNASGHDCSSGPDGENFYILKRIMVERGNAVYLSGLREKYFGEVFSNASASVGGSLEEGFLYSFPEKANSGYHTLESNDSVHAEMEYIKPPIREEGLNHIARYIESFESQSKEIWLVFQNEGTSLSKLIYTTESMDTDGDVENSDRVRYIQVLRPSTWWHWLKTTEAGKETMRSLIWQLLMALKSCHDRNITHRDIKLENMVICIEDERTGRCLKGMPSGDKLQHIKMRVIDFGSGIDEFTMNKLYGSNGPSRSEQTYDYTPPEALLNTRWFQGPKSVVQKYDMWSVGVVMLELILGSPDVFQLNARTGALLDKHLEGWNEGVKELAYRLRSFMEMCILIPSTASKRDHSGSSPAAWKCSEEYFSHQVKSRDPLKQGFPNEWALRLVRQLLQWDPEDRLSVDEALQHPYFQPPTQV